MTPQPSCAPRPVRARGGQGGTCAHVDHEDRITWERLVSARLLVRVGWNRKGISEGFVQSGSELSPGPTFPYLTLRTAV